MDQPVLLLDRRHPRPLSSQDNSLALVWQFKRRQGGGSDSGKALITRSMRDKTKTDGIGNLDIGVLTDIIKKYDVCDELQYTPCGKVWSWPAE